MKGLVIPSPPPPPLPLVISFPVSDAAPPTAKLDCVDAGGAPNRDDDGAVFLGPSSNLGGWVAALAKLLWALLGGAGALLIKKDVDLVPKAEVDDEDAPVLLLLASVLFAKGEACCCGACRASIALRMAS